ncbi:MAG: hypothetical protein HYU77_04665 [Betaproteobacteria bacterium]|nr:hypothetical protein [Betaproteobacteria bacterium]
MPSKFIFSLTADRFSAYQWQNNQLLDEHVFTSDAFGQERFSEYLLRVGSKPVYVLADLVEEDYRFDQVPHLIGPERSALFNRKLDQYYRNTPFRHALTQGRQEEGRRDDRVLFSALTNPALITPWIDLMLQRSVAIAGLYSVSLICKQLIRDVSSPQLLLITWQKHAGLRQTYFQNSQVNFSRLTPLAQGDDPVDKVVAESARTLQYLNSLSLLPPDRPLDVFIVCSSRDRQELQARLSSTPSLRYVFLDIRQVARSLDLKEGPGDSDATPLLLQVLGRYPLHNQYGAPAHTHFFSLLKLRRVLNGLALAAGAASVLVGGAYFWVAAGLQNTIGEVAGKARELSATYQRITSDFPPAPTSAANMQTAVVLAEKLAALAPPPQGVLAPVARTLDAFPGIQVNGLSWHNTFTPDDVKPDYAPAGGTVAAPEQKAPAPGARPAPAQAPEKPYQVIFLQGEIVPFDNNYRRAIDTINGFQDALRRNGLTVSTLTLPLDLRPEATVSSELSAQQGQSRRAVFVLKLVTRQAEKSAPPAQGGKT